MGDEIDAVKELIKAIVKAERDSPIFYILGTFNDPGIDTKAYIHYVQQFSNYCNQTVYEVQVGSYPVSSKNSYVAT